MVTFPDSVLLVSVNVSVSSVLDVSTWMLSRTDSVMHLLKRQDVPHPVTIRQSDIINISLFISKIVDVLNNSIRKDFRAFTHRFFRKKICAIITVVHEEMFDQDGRAYRLPQHGEIGIPIFLQGFGLPRPEPLFRCLVK